MAACDVRVGEGGLSLGIAHGRASDEWTRTYTLSPGGRLEIVNVNGSIQVDPATGTQVEIQARREVRTGSDETARVALQNMQMNEEVTPERVKVEGRLEGERSSRFGRGSGLVIEYKVKIPAGLSASFKTENGTVRMDNIEGRLVATTTNGGVNGRGLSGSVDAATVNGGIQMDMASVTGDVNIVTVNGGVRLELPTDVKAELQAGAVNGGVSVDDRLPFTGGERNSSGGFPGGGPKHLNGTLNGGGPKISVQTTNGGVRVSARASHGT